MQTKNSTDTIQKQNILSEENTKGQAETNKMWDQN